MTGILIYDKQGLSRNTWFAKEIIENLKQIGIQTSLLDSSEISEYVTASFDFAIVRTINTALSEYLENKGMRAFNNCKTSVIANNKWLTYLFGEEHGIKTMPTQFASNNSCTPEAYPVIIKSLDGHGGNEVFFVNNEAEFRSSAAKIQGDFIVQEPCSDLGIDMRVYVLGGKIIAAVQRRSETDFRSNFSLGGRASITDIEPYQVDYINRIIDTLHCDYVGIDFIYHNGRWVLNEIEDVVGSRMLYQLTEIDVAKIYAEHIKTQLSR